MITSNFETLSKLTQSKLHYNVCNNSGSVFKEFGKDKKAAYDFAATMNETAIICGDFIFKKYG